MLLGISNSCNIPLETSCRSIAVYCAKAFTATFNALNALPHPYEHISPNGIKIASCIIQNVHPNKMHFFWQILLDKFSNPKEVS